MKISKQSVELKDYMGSDLSVVNSARVSFDKEHQEFQDNDPGLINYLAKHNHWSPFAHTSLTFRIKAPIFVARQMVKHQVGGVWNEVSRRYVNDEPEFYFPDVWRGKPVNAKQGSDGELDIKSVRPSIYSSVEKSLEAYINALEDGIAPEQARMVLPQNTMTTWWWTGSLAFFARVCKQRLDAHAQQETRDIAQMINDQIPEEFKHSWQALMA